ncbi:MAG TPA: response regulator, partial [Rhodospirillales bacterium]|nr:response regulator [Rhodospirillales bacterium]
MRVIVKRILASLGSKNIREAEDGADGLKVLQTFFPDIIITDWVMDPIDGIEMSHMIRNSSDSKNPFVPIIMLTAHSEISRIIKARDSGINEIVVKPVSVKSLFS